MAMSIKATASVRLTRVARSTSVRGNRGRSPGLSHHDVIAGQRRAADRQSGTGPNPESFRHCRLNRIAWFDVNAAEPRGCQARECSDGRKPQPRGAQSQRRRFVEPGPRVCARSDSSPAGVMKMPALQSRLARLSDGERTRPELFHACDHAHTESGLQPRLLNGRRPASACSGASKLRAGHASACSGAKKSPNRATLNR